MNVITILSKFIRNSSFPVLKARPISVLSQRHSSNDLKSDSKEEHESKEESDEEYDKNIREKILNASIPYVMELGWSTETIAKGAQSLGYPGVTHGLFPRGGADLVHHFYTECNKTLALQLKQESEAAKSINPSKFVRDAVESRLRMVIPYKSKWPQAIALMALPPNVPKSLANLLMLVDDICYYAGDRSVDFKWYSRRVALGGLYKTTELYMLQDNSPDHVHTWEFLSRRIDELFQIHALLGQTENFNNVATETFSSAFATARHILGINWTR